MSTPVITRVSALALAVVGAALALTSTAAPANAAFSWEGQDQCTALGGSYDYQLGSSGDILHWSCTYQAGEGQADVSLRAVCTGQQTFTYGPAGTVFTCWPITGPPAGYPG